MAGWAHDKIGTATGCTIIGGDKHKYIISCIDLTELES